MRILIVGGSGFIGQALVNYFQAQNYAVVVIGRDKAKLEKIFNKQIVCFNWQVLHDPQQLKNIDVVINLAGENIAGGRWTESRKQRILDSRITTTQQLVTAFRYFYPKPSCFICASGVGIYPITRHIYDESWKIKEEEITTFLGKLAYKWESTARQAEAMGIRVVSIRQGAVLGMTGGMLKSMVWPYKLGLGGRIGSGQQPLPWIALPDVIRAIDFIIKQPHLAGPINLVAPNSIDQANFAKILASVLHRRAFLAMPAWLLTLIFGQLADELFLNGVKVIPKKLLAAGFVFKYPVLDKALTALFAHNI